MLGFGGEEYTRELYDETRRKGEEEVKDANIAYGNLPDKDLNIGIYNRDFEVYERLHEVIKNSQKKLDKKLDELRVSANSEAIKLNEEYDRLMQKIRESQQALLDFQRDKLGIEMKEESAIKETEA
jgi:SMC interacting uncharacterized protein involved in chromosome segregation